MNETLEPVSIVLVGLSAAAEVAVRAAIPEKLGRQFRAMKIVNDGYNADDHTVTFALSSATPVDRGYCMEILSHEKGAIRLDRLKNGVPLLFNHDMDLHLGVSTKYEIGDDGVLRLTCRFGPSPLAVEKEADVAARILKDTSVGYVVHEWEIVEDTKGNRTMTATDWEPLEGSLVTVPADMFVGVGRSFNDEVPVKITSRKAKPVEPAEDDDEDEDDEDEDEDDENTGSERSTKPKTTRNNMPEPVVAPAAVVVAEPAIDNATRVAELRKLSTQYPDFFNARSLKLAEDLGYSLERAKTLVADAAIAAAQRSDIPTIADEVFGGMTARDLTRYEIVGAYRAAVNMRTPGTFTGKQEGGYEREVGQELLKTASARGVNDLGAGVPVPSFRALVAAQQRTIASGGNAGAATNFTTVTTDPIELLRSRTVLLAMGARMITGLHGAVQMTKQTGGGTSNWVTEGTSATNSDPTLGFFTMKPNRLTMQNSYFRDFLAQSGLAIDSFLSDDRLQTLTRALDTAGLVGSGSAPIPLGLLNQTGLAGTLSGATRSSAGVYTAGAGGVPMTYVDWNNLEAAISAANGDIGTIGIITTPKVRAAARSTPQIPGTASGFCWPNSKMGANGVQEGPLGYNAICTNNTALTGFTANSISGLHAVIAGVFGEYLFADWGLGEVVADPYTGAGAAKYIITEHAYFDANVRHIEAFAANTSVLPS